VTPVLLDTNVLSEILSQRADESVVAFVESLDRPVISAVTFHELHYGVELMPKGLRRSRLSAGIAAFQERFKDRTIAVEGTVAALSGRLRADEQRAGFTLTPLDSLIAACALASSAMLATRNIKDFKRLGIQLIDPWKGA